MLFDARKKVVVDSFGGRRRHVHNVSLQIGGGPCEEVDGIPICPRCVSSDVMSITVTQK